MSSVVVARPLSATAGQILSPNFSRVCDPPCTRVTSLNSMSLLLRNASIEPLLQSIHSILSSGRNDDHISEELAEICGFDHIDLVMEMLNDRSTTVKEVWFIQSLTNLVSYKVQLEDYLGRQSSYPGPSDASGRSSGKGDRDACQFLGPLFLPEP